MSTKCMVWGSLALLMTLSSAAALAASAAGDEQVVTAAEHQWLKSQQTNDVEMLAPLLADKVVETTGEGKVISGKDAVLADAKSVTWNGVEYTDLKITVFGHTAIATGTFIANGKDAGGKPLDERMRFTDTWVKMADGKWLCVATTDTPLKK